MGILANGYRTDNPIPGYPFVDDSFLPLDDRNAIERLGRHQGEGRWGRTDSIVVPGQQLGQTWHAFTTDPTNHDHAWIVSHSPSTGTTVLLVTDNDAVNIYSDSGPEEVRFITRRGGYWYDGTQWRRPASAGIASLRLPCAPVPDVKTITAESALRAASTAIDIPNGTFPAREAAPHTAEFLQWADQSLRDWATRRTSDSRPLSDCIVTVTAPELTPSAMLDTTAVAERAAIAASTLRSYITRGQNSVPEPQQSGPTLWSVPVVDCWVAQRAADQRPADRINAEIGAVLNGVAGDLNSALRGKVTTQRKLTAEDVAAALRGRVPGITRQPAVARRIIGMALAAEFKSFGNLNDDYSEFLSDLLIYDSAMAIDALDWIAEAGQNMGLSTQQVRDAIRADLTANGRAMFDTIAPTLP